MSETVRITVKLTPKAAKNAVLGWADGPEGSRWLKCTVTAVPEKGKANKALIALLAEHFHVNKGAISLIRGETDKIKTVDIQGISLKDV